MKKIICIFLLLVFACSSENANDCFQTTGSTIQQEISVDNFTKILVNRNVQLILNQGPETNVIVETGDNLINDIEVVVVEDELKLTDNNTCNYVRDYKPTKVFVTAPNIREIRNSSQFEVASEGVLNYTTLKLISENFNNVDEFAVGDFRLNVDNETLSITTNNISSLYISGEVTNLSIGFYGGAGRFEGAGLNAQNISIFHRGSNDIIVNPLLSITGEIRSTGDVISINTPPIVEVEEFYTGKLLFN